MTWQRIAYTFKCPPLNTTQLKQNELQIAAGGTIKTFATIVTWINEWHTEQFITISFAMCAIMGFPSSALVLTLCGQGKQLFHLDLRGYLIAVNYTWTVCNWLTKHKLNLEVQQRNRFLISLSLSLFDLQSQSELLLRKLSWEII